MGGKMQRNKSSPQDPEYGYHCASYIDTCPIFVVYSLNRKGQVFLDIQYNNLIGQTN